MSDSHERKIVELTRSIAEIYLLIKRVCAKLPIPISLPGGPEYRSDELMPAVARVVEIIGEQPASEEIQANIFGACLSWLSASKILMHFMNHEDDTTAEAEITLLLIAAGDAAIDAAHEVHGESTE